MGSIKVLIIDDSAMVRKILSKQLESEKDIKVVGTAPNPYIGRDKIIKFNPDVLILDIEMPRMDGLTFLEKLMKHKPMPVIIVSSLAKNGGDVALKAIELGASEVIAKPGSSYTIGDMTEQLVNKIRAVSKMKRIQPLKNISKSGKTSIKSSHMIKTSNKIIAIGASTGGTEAIKQVLLSLPANMPPILIVQHMPQHFTKSFADRLNKICEIEVKEASDNEIASPGKVLIAPGNQHMVLKRSGAVYKVKLKEGPLVYHQRPSVEVLFNSVAKYAGPNAIGVILTGMGKDGALGLLEMKKAGAYTIAQNEETSVVYGMPKEAVEKGGVVKELALNNISEILVRLSHNS